MSKLILAEKPSVAKNIADAFKCKARKNGYIEGNGYIVTWAFGHLLTLYDCKDYDEKLAKWNMKNFPYIPSEFKYKIKMDSKTKNKTDSGAKNQLNIIKSLSNREDVTEIIVATDYDREGELIALLIFQYLKVQKPMYRILINEWTFEEINRGMSNLKTNEEMRPLQDAGVSRQLADWVIGINLTSVATMKYARGIGNVLNIGRVIMPTLKMIYDRDKQISDFKSEAFYDLEVEFENESGKYKGKFFHGKIDKFKNKSSVEKLKKEIQGKEGTIIKKDVTTKKENPPSLFNLTNLQGDITSKYKGWTSDKVLKVAQELYEKKLITYPRTASTALEETLKKKAKKVLNVQKKGLPYEGEVKFNDSTKVFNNKKVESHSAIIPTYVIAKNLSDDEKKVYNAIKDRFIAQFMESAQFEHTQIITSVKGEKYDRLFKTKGKILITEGWLKTQKKSSKKDEFLPPLKKDDKVEIASIKLHTKKSKPPAHHTEKTLLKSMESCGRNVKDDENNESDELLSSVLSGYSIGTPATRAEIISKLKSAGYVKTKGKSLIITQKGMNLIEGFPIKELLDTDYTGKLEKTLSDIEKNNVSKDKFLNYIYEFTKKGVEKIKDDRYKVISDTREEKDKPKKEVIGKCPVCGHDVVENKAAFGCSNWVNGCKFTIWKNDKFIEKINKKVTKTMVKTILKDGNIKINNLNGNKFDAILTYEKNLNNDYWSWKIVRI